MLSSIAEYLFNSPYAWSTCSLLLVAWIIGLARNSKSSQRSDLPLLVDASPAVDIRSQLIQTYKQSKLWRILWSHNECILLPSRLVSEIAALPEEKVSFGQDLFLRFHGRYTTVGTSHEDGSMANVASLARIDLTRHLSESISKLQDELLHILPIKFGDSGDWVPVPVYTTISFTVAQVTARVFVGLPLCRSKQWIDLTVNYTRTAMMGSAKLWEHSQWLLPILAPFTKEIRAINGSVKEAKQLLIPILNERRRKLATDPSYVPPDDSITWSIQEAQARDWNPRRQALTQLTLGMASVHTTTGLITNAIFDLCAYPEHVPTLRKEWRAVLDSEDSLATKKLGVKLRKMDSFLREVQRVHPAQQAGMGRYIPKDLTLSDGTFLPGGSFTMFPLYAINFDPELYPEPEKFDPWRFERLREQDKKADAHWQFVHTDPLDNVNFGHGKHACPGRFFASNEMKLLLGYLIDMYEFKFENPDDGRPECLTRGASLAPDPTKKILFKRREKGS